MSYHSDFERLVQTTTRGSLSGRLLESSVRGVTGYFAELKNGQTLLERRGPYEDPDEADYEITKMMEEFFRKQRGIK